VNWNGWLTLWASRIPQAGSVRLRLRRALNGSKRC
jgi:hypothetical protein